MEAARPVLFKGFMRDWPLVQTGLRSPAEAIAYLKRFDGGRPVVGFTGPPGIGGRFFYDAGLSGLNFDAARVPLGDFLDRIARHLDDPAPPAFYIGSTDLDLYLPGIADENGIGIDALTGRPPVKSIWIGNRTVASTHHDMSNNIACCAAGRRRFTLFPPDQVANLYPGPLEPTPGGQVVSMVDLRAPDLDRYPRFAEALAHAQVAEMEPGDLLFYPALWWHNVEALEPFNILVNYWWNDVPAFMDTPQNTLLHALLSLRDRPEQEKAAWRAMFDYYVFGPAEMPAAHLPAHAQGALGPLDEMKARRLRAQLLQRLNR
ncbi:cupin-like domain-containing protein [Sphingomonas canadensis]|nr:cupin-like domain-containing protein [Sphingomonas canadensis]MCW3837700.1 cupin-like domain-containing protein [Sphingomonas canadensis]